MSEIYKHFSIEWEDCLDFSDESLLELYISESYGDITCSSDNGFYVGKQWLNVTVSMWKEDMVKGLLFEKELYEDPTLPDWWLDKVFKN